MTYYHRIILYFDGASRNNPHGPAAYGWVLYEMDKHGADGYRIASGSKYIGYNKSNNQAEYAGLSAGLLYIRYNIECFGLYVRGDSEIVINQMNGEYQVRSPNIIDYYNRATGLREDIDCQHYSFRHISRDRNWEADQLAKSHL
jgi:ribonuclease HI